MRYLKTMAGLIPMLTVLLLAGGCGGPPPDGRLVVEESCLRCHSMNRLMMAEQDQAGWQQSVERMNSSNRLGLNRAERRAAAQYLFTLQQEQ